MNPTRCILGLVLLTATGADAAVYYDERARAIRVVDYPKESPCTLSRLLYMDRLCGWGKVTYDPDTDTYTIAGDLAVGTNDGTDTYLQVGSRRRPRETLVMRGNLLVSPYWIAGENAGAVYYRAPEAVNRLTIGVKGDASVAAALKFDDKARTGYTLRLGCRPGPDGKLTRGHGGQLHVYHGTITSATPEPGGEFGSSTGVGGMHLGGNSVVLDHATVSWVAGAATYGLGRNGRVTHTIFDRVGMAIINGQHELTGCTFRNSRIAVRDFGSIDAVLTDCVFEGNDHNWTLTHSAKGIVCIDCTYGKPRRGNQYRCWKSRRTGQMQYPSFTSRRHIVVEVTDEAGRPVPGALVRARCEQETAEIMENATQRTGKLGRTPAKGEDGAILLVEVVERATDIPNRPKVTVLSYTIEASAKGFAPNRLEHFRPTESWHVVRIVLRKP